MRDRQQFDDVHGVHEGHQATDERARRDWMAGIWDEGNSTSHRIRLIAAVKISVLVRIILSEKWQRLDECR